MLFQGVLLALPLVGGLLSDSRHEFKFDVPDRWTLHETPFAASLYQMTAPDIELEGEVRPVITISVREGNLADVIDAEIASLRTDVPTVDVATRVPFQLGGSRAEELFIRYELLKKPLAALIWAVEHPRVPRAIVLIIGTRRNPPPATGIDAFRRTFSSLTFFSTGERLQVWAEERRTGLLSGVLLIGLVVALLAGIRFRATVGQK